MSNYNYLEVCAGCGGLSFGLEMAGLVANTLVEINSDCTKTLEKNFKCVKILNEDMRNVDFTKFKNTVDIVVSGIPCQSHSTAGKREGLNNTNKGGLFFDFLRCLKEVEPRMFIIENVEGLHNINKGETLKFIVKELEKLNFTVKYQILNSVDYLVPQKRKRIIIVGTSHSVDFKYPPKQNKVLTMRDALKDVPDSKGMTYSDAKKKIMEKVPAGGCWIDLPLKLQKSYLGKSFESGGGKRGIARRLSWDEPCLTLTTSPAQKQTERCHPDEVRPLRIREYARIQTFPDSFVFEGSVSSTYRQIGNAVPCFLGYFIGKQIVQCMNEIRIQELFCSIQQVYFQKKDEKNSTKYEISINSTTNKAYMEKLEQLFVTFYRANILPLYDEKVIPTDIDRFSKIINQCSDNLSELQWIELANQSLRSTKIAQQVGNMHQYIISNLDGWMNCKDHKNSSIFKADVMRKDCTMFLELKNKYSTMNAGNKTILNDLIEIKKKYPNAIVGIGIINPKVGKDCKKKIHENPDIYEYSGKELSKLVYGSNKLFDDLYKIIVNYFADNKKDLYNSVKEMDNVAKQNKKTIEESDSDESITKPKKIVKKKPTNSDESVVKPKKVIKKTTIESDNESMEEKPKKIKKVVKKK